MARSTLEARGGRDPDLTKSRVFTIGHGLLEREQLLELLRSHGVDTIIDVRSQPHSARAPQFNREALERVSGVTYRWMPALGGRPPAHLRIEGTDAPDYERMAREPETRAALDEIAALTSQRSIALMCSESRPEECHRSRMLEPELARRGVWVEHILHSGEAAAVPTLFA
jgi:uncharacterized protein (DUF488 family)